MHKTSIQFEHLLWLKLEAYRKIVGATNTGVIRLAVEEYIKAQTRLNKDIGKKHEQKMTELLAAAGNNIAAIGTRRKSRKKALAVDEKSDTGAQIQK